MIVFILVLSAVFWLGLIFIAGITIFMPAQRDINLNYYLPIVLPDASGIKHGTRVYVLGVDVGYVRYIGYVTIDQKGNLLNIHQCIECDNSRSYQLIIAVLNIRRKIEFYENYKIFAKMYNVIGEKVIEIDPGSKIESINQRKKELKTLDVRYLTINEFYQFFQTQYVNINIHQLPEIKNYDDPLTIVWSVINENRENLKKIFINTREATEKINNGHGTISLLLNENAIHENADGVLFEVILLIQFFGELAESLREHNIVSKTISGAGNFLGGNNKNK